MKIIQGPYSHNLSLESAGKSRAEKIRRTQTMVQLHEHASMFPWEDVWESLLVSGEEAKINEEEKRLTDKKETN